jgi:hypothetical protein
MTRHCTACEVTKVRSEFYSPTNSYCRPCHRELRRERGKLKAAHPMPYKHSCPICDRDGPMIIKTQSQNPRYTQPAFVLDHDHGSGLYRDHLCSRCNIGLGKFKDDPILLSKAIGYLLIHIKKGLDGESNP